MELNNFRYVEEGSPVFVCGCSGTELALSVFEKVGFELMQETENTFDRFDRSPEYWAGWILAYYQWETNLHNLRKTSGLTQKELSELAGVNLRTLQQYEIGSKDINKASGKTINSFALALHCNFYDVMELVLP